MAAIGSKRVIIKTEVLDDVSSRFLINLSNEEKDDPIKLCSHIELAYWYYLDLMRPEDLSLPACNHKEFMATILQHCPWLVRGATSSSKDLEKLIADWKLHKYSKPVRGAILLNQDLTKCLLVQGYPSRTAWTFPKGKLEEGEEDKDAAVREVFEETGFDIRVLIQKSDFLDACIHDSNARMYIIPGVPEDAHFEAKTRKEIRCIQWFKISDLPSYKKDQTSKLTQGKGSNFFMVIPFVGQLRHWIQQRKNKGRGISASFKTHSQPSDMSNCDDGRQQVKELSSTAQLSIVTPHSTSKVQAALPSSAVGTAGQGFGGNISVRDTAALVPQHQLMTGSFQHHRATASPPLLSAAASITSIPTPQRFANTPQTFQPMTASQRHPPTSQLFQPAAGPRIHHTNYQFMNAPQPFQLRPSPQPAAVSRTHPTIPLFVNTPQPFQPMTAAQLHQARPVSGLLQPAACSSAYSNTPQPFQPTTASQLHQARPVSGLLQPAACSSAYSNTPQPFRPTTAAQLHQARPVPQLFPPAACSSAYSNIPQPFQPMTAAQLHQARPVPQLFQPAACSSAYSNTPQPFQPMTAAQLHQARPVSGLLQPAACSSAYSNTPQPFQPMAAAQLHQARPVSGLLQPAACSSAYSNTPQPFQPMAAAQLHQARPVSGLLQPAACSSAYSNTPQPFQPMAAAQLHQARPVSGLLQPAACSSAYSNTPQPFQPMAAAQLHQARPVSGLLQPAACSSAYSNTPQPFQPMAAAQLHQARPVSGLLQPAACSSAYSNTPQPFQPMAAAQLHQARPVSGLLQPAACSSSYSNTPQPFQPTTASQLHQARPVSGLLQPAYPTTPQPFQPMTAAQFHQFRSPQPTQLTMETMPTPQYLHPATTDLSNQPSLATPIHTSQQLSVRPSAVLYNPHNSSRPQPSGPLQQHLHSPSPRHALLPTPQLATSSLPNGSNGTYGQCVALRAPVVAEQVLQQRPVPHAAQQSLLPRPPSAGLLSKAPLLPAPLGTSSAPSPIVQPKHPQWNQQGWREGMGTATTSMSLQPVAGLVGFRFNKEAIMNELHTR